MAYPTGGLSYGMQYRDNILSAPQDHGTFSQPPYQEYYYPSASMTRDHTALSQPPSQDDRNSSGPDLSFGQSSTETASTLFDASSNRGGPDSAMYEPPAIAGRPTFSYPPDTLDGVAVALCDTLEVLTEENLTKWLVDEADGDNVSVPTLE
jgi:hypothetical protein